MLLVLALCLAGCTAAVSGAEPAAALAGNLLVNSEVEDGMEGWTAAAMDEPTVFHGESILRSGIYQDVSLEGIMPGQLLKLSGRIAAAPEDPDQLVAEMGLAVYGADGTVIHDMEIEQEIAKEPVWHEIVTEVPEGAAFARVCLTIYKKSARNAFCCEDLCLEEIPAENGSSVAEDTSYTVTNLNISDDAVTWNGHYYSYYQDTQISWTMAEHYCSIRNGHLVTITSDEEQAFLESAFPGTAGWIGASIQEDGTWNWVTGEALDYTNWIEGEPDNQSGTQGYACLSEGMKWADLPDEDAAFHTGYYCEWDTPTVTYARDGIVGGSISDETRTLLEEGQGYYYGTGPEGYDIGKAWECFASATDDYSALAWYYLGRIMASGKKNTGPDPYIRAMGAYEKAITYGLSMGWMGQAELYLNGQGVPVDYDKALQLYQRAIDLGCVEANYGMGRLYQYGLGVEKDGINAMQYYQKATESEDYGWRNIARDALGDLYYEGGAGIEPDYAQAINWYMTGAQEGYGPCCNNLGYMYYQGNGVEQDYGLAAYWFEMAASHGERDGCYNIAFLYENGIGVEQNYPLALEYYRKAALMGDIWAMYDLGRLYEEGLGTEKDYVLAREWYQKALLGDDVSAKLRTDIEEKLARIQSEEEAALLANPNPDPMGNYGQYLAPDYSPFGYNPEEVIDYSAYGLYPDGTIDYSAFDMNPEEAATYGDEITDPGTADPVQNVPESADSGSMEPEGAANIDSGTLPPEEPAGAVPEEIPG